MASLNKYTTYRTLQIIRGGKLSQYVEFNRVFARKLSLSDKTYCTGYFTEEKLCNY